jgi:hypothetical protein
MKRSWLGKKKKMLSAPLHFNISNEMENHIHLHEVYLYDFQVISKIDKIKKN